MSKAVKDEYSVLIEADNSKHGKPESRLQELIKKIILICLGCFFAYMSISSFAGAFRSQAEAAIAVISAAIWGVGAGLCFGHHFLGKIGQRIGDAIYMPSASFKTPPDQLSPIRGLIIEGKNDEAIEKLDAILERKPFEPEPYLILIEIYLEHLGQPQKAVDMIKEYFIDLSHRSSKQKRKKLRIAPENIDMVMIYSDTCQELGMTDQAVKLLQQEAARKGYSVPDKHAIDKRLNVLEEQM